MISKPLLKTRCMFGTTIPCLGWTFGNFNMFGKLSNIWIFELLVNFGKNEVSKKSAVPFKYFSSCLKKWSLELGKYTKIHSEHSTCLLNLHNTFIWNTFNLSLWWLLIGGWFWFPWGSFPKLGLHSWYRNSFLYTSLPVPPCQLYLLR